MPARNRQGHRHGTRGGVDIVRQGSGGYGWSTTTRGTRGVIEASTLPRWDLSDLFCGPDDPAITASLDGLADEAEAFAGDYRGHLSGLSTQAFGELIERYAALVEGMGRVGSYADLLFAANRNDDGVARFHQMVQERMTAVNQSLIFLGLEINRLDEETVERLLGDPDIARYRTWLEALRNFRPHQLSDEAEAMLNELAVVQAGAWVRLFDQTIAALTFRVDGEELSEAEALDRLSWADAGVRKRTAGELARVFRGNTRLFSHITNTLARMKAIEDGWRSFARPISSRNVANLIEDETVDALMGAVRDAYPRLSHRYFALKAGWFGGDTLAWWDRNAPLPDTDEPLYGWDEARDIVLGAFGGFSPRMAGIAADFFRKKWIDAPCLPGKDGGAFSHPTVPGVHPYILLNYQGRTRDVMTLAHELGHGVHQVLAGPQGPLLAPTPLTLAETASVFGEQLAFRHLLEREDDPRTRRRLLAGKVEDMLNTVVRQIAFCDFEVRLHDARAKGELTPDEIGDLWMATQRESLGPAVHLDDDYRSFWCYIPHFIHAPFYVYAYAFGDCLVNALHALHRQGVTGFERMFLALLEAGGSRHHRELLAPFGLDATKREFWAQGLGSISDMIDELEALPS